MLSEIISRCKSFCALDVYIRKDCPVFYKTHDKVLRLDDVKISQNDIEDFFKDTAPDSAKEFFIRKGWTRYSFLTDGKSGPKFFTRVDAVLEGESKGLSLRLMPEHIPDLSSIFGQGTSLDFLKKGDGLFLVSGRSCSCKTTFLSSLIEDLNSKESLRILEVTDAIAFHHECKNSFIRQIETTDSRDLMWYALKTSWDLIVFDVLPDAALLESALKIAEKRTKVILTVTASSATRALEDLSWLFLDRERQEKRERLAKVLDGVMYIEPQWLPDGRVVLASEILVAIQSIRNLLRDGKFKEISDSIATGQKHGMRTLESSISDLQERGITFG